MSTHEIGILPQLILKKPVRTYTLEEYLRREAKAIDKHEFINGQIIKMPFAKGPHNIIAANMIAQIATKTENLTENYIVFGSDQKVYFPSLDEGVYADTLAVCDKPLYWDDQELLLINPILIVEVLSKSTQKYDRVGKFEKYKTLESFKEYVMIRQNEAYAEVWYRERPGLWHETIVTDMAASIPLQSLGIELPMQRIYRNVNIPK
ncbi:MAG: Uma2 family endonuclease [Runella slithyformis]|nr:MAG: Uma2 family endonuclease [Runella slithyformis]TAE95405.1 MAG: Uma2 family endonuclease [Runella slithyformis]TAF29203.1 MAG: Uma2 family endonuclease [Runella slithyformis]TAF48071.1 MAG: Uma2 family endonuclease [Runella slithyformis]TAF82862.1 MAG: Uma2 family endonuclease [Runella slithyformis]